MILPLEDLQKINFFKDHYELELLYNTKDVETIGKKKREEIKSCRFCGLSAPVAKFKKDAHVFTEQFGGSNLLSHLECDSCNNRFSVYESHLSNYYLFDKVVLGLKNKHNIVPTYKLNDKRIELLDEKSDKLPEILNQHPALKNTKAKLILLDGFNIPPNYDISSDTLKLEETKNSYKPFFIYKSLLKTGLTLIEEEEVKNYKVLMNTLNSDKEQEAETNIYHALEFTMDMYVDLYKHPILYLFKKKVEGYIEKVLIIFFGNKILQIPLFSDLDFKSIKNGKSPKAVPFHPLVIVPQIDVLYDQRAIDIFLDFKVEYLDLSSSAIVKGSVNTREFHWVRGSNFEIDLPNK